MEDKMMGEEKEYARYEAYQTSDEDYVIYDTENHTAWVKCEQAVSLEDLR